MYNFYVIVTCQERKCIGISSDYLNMCNLEIVKTKMLDNIYLFQIKIYINKLKLLGKISAYVIYDWLIDKRGNIVWRYFSSSSLYEADSVKWDPGIWNVLQDSVKGTRVSSTQINQSNVLINYIGLICNMHVLIKMELILGRWSWLNKMDSDSLATGPPSIFPLTKREAPPWASIS